MVDDIRQYIIKFRWKDTQKTYYMIYRLYSGYRILLIMSDDIKCVKIKLRRNMMITKIYYNDIIWCMG